MQGFDCDVAVVGGGPSGFLSACEAAKAGCRVVVFEEHRFIGRPEKCAGLLSLSGLRRLSIDPSPRFVVNRVRGAVFKSPGGREFTVDSGKPVAAVASREKFDQHLSSKASREGVEIRLNCRVTSIKDTPQCVVVDTARNGTLRSKALLDAEGRGGRLARSVGISCPPSKWLPSVQALVANHGRDERYVYLFFKEYIQGFFGYLVPLNGELGKVGLASRSSGIEAMTKLLGSEFPGSKILGVSASAIYTGRPAASASAGSVLAVGDAAGQVKATTGGGVIFGGLCATHAGRVAAEACTGSSSTTSTLKKYDLLLNKGLHKELRAMASIRAIIDRLPPKHIDYLFNTVKKLGFDSLASELGDMDFQGESLLRAATSSRLPQTLLRSLTAFVSGLLN